MTTRQLEKHQSEIREAVAQIEGHAKETEHLLSDMAWMHEWNDLADANSGARLVSGEHVQFDVSIFGPKVKSRKMEDIADEIEKLMLKKESDFTDAMINVDHDDFLSGAYETCLRDTSVMKRIVADLYSNFRDMFLAVPLETAMQLLHFYREGIRAYRAQIYLANLIMERVEQMHSSLTNLESLKEKYEATIFTLRRQLQDFHGHANTVGRTVEGEFKAVTIEKRADGAAAGASTGAASPREEALEEGATTQCFIIVVQVEELGALRQRHRLLMDASLATAKSTIASLAQSYELMRTNYNEEDEREVPGKRTSIPLCYMFTTDTAFNAFAFGLELNVILDGLEEWPKSLLDMSRFATSPWRGLKVRVGIHFGAPTLMDLPDIVKVTHYEGIPVEKAMRVAGLGSGGDVLMSTSAWQAYQKDLQEGRIPPSKRYQCLRGCTTEIVDCSRKRGFKKKETVQRSWAVALAQRQQTPQEMEFGPVFFFRLDATQADVPDDEGPTAEELVAAKDTELTLLQQGAGPLETRSDQARHGH